MPQADARARLAARQVLLACVHTAVLGKLEQRDPIVEALLLLVLVGALVLGGLVIFFDWYAHRQFKRRAQADDEAKADADEAHISGRPDGTIESNDEGGHGDAAREGQGHGRGRRRVSLLQGRVDSLLAHFGEKLGERGRTAPEEYGSRASLTGDGSQQGASGRHSSMVDLAVDGATRPSARPPPPPRPPAAATRRSLAQPPTLMRQLSSWRAQGFEELPLGEDGQAGQTAAQKEKRAAMGVAGSKALRRARNASIARAHRAGSLTRRSIQAPPQAVATELGMINMMHAQAAPL